MRITIPAATEFKSLSQILNSKIRIHARFSEEWLSKAVIQNPPIPAIQNLVSSYRSNNNITTPLRTDKLTNARRMQIADAYDAMPHEPSHPDVQRTYTAFKHQALQQWQHLHNNGYKAEAWTQPGQPYNNSHELMHDLHENKHLWYFPTLGANGAYGERPEDAPEEHPMLEPTGMVSNGRHVVYNDVFRAVHDFYGHGAEGYQFGPIGEENAWKKHSSMFTPEAQPALTNETHAQNSWINFGKHLRVNGKIPKLGEPGWVHPADRPYAQQKAGLLPPELWAE